MGGGGGGIVQYHDVANLFPMMNDDEYAALVADIHEHGQRDPIWLLDDQVLDGRNRWQACRDLGIAAHTRQYDGPNDTPSLVNFVVSLNLKRRHLNSGQLAVVTLDIEKILSIAAKERQGARNDITQKFAECHAGEAREQAAAIMGTNRQYVSDAKKIAQHAPDLLEGVRAGSISITDAKRELKERGRESVREQNRMLIEYTPPATIYTPAATYQTIVLDPPWDWGDEGDVDQFGRARPTYATMSIEEIAELPVLDLSAENAHIYLWITNRSLPKGFALLQAWGFRYITALTWCKPHFGMGNYFRGQTEQVLFGVRGSLPLLRNNVGTWFEAPRGARHSSKPDDFYELVETCSPGPWLEMFAREPRMGWVSWGAEVCTTLQ